MAPQEEVQLRKCITHAGGGLSGDNSPQDQKRSPAYAENAEYQREERLTMTETVILQYLVQGLTNAQICQEMKLKLPTVKGHIYNIYKKMNVKNRVQAVMKWKEETE